MPWSMGAGNELHFFWWSFLGYSMACIAYVAYLALEKKRIATTATSLMAVAFVLHTVAIVLRAVHLGRLPLSNMFEYINLLAWLAAIAYFLTLRVYRLQVLGAFVGPLVFMLMAAGSLLPKQAEMQLIPALQSYWLQIHVTVAALGEAAFAVAFAANIMYFLKRAMASDSRLARRLPDLKALDRIGYKAVTVGYPLFTVGALFAGAIWAEQAWGSFWSWDPKEVGSLVAWLVYSAYLHARFVKGWTGTRAAVLSTIGFICTLLTFFANMFLGGLHAYG